MPIEFWAYVGAIGQTLGYSDRGSNLVKEYSQGDMIEALSKLDRPHDILGTKISPSTFARQLTAYFKYRADKLNVNVRQNLMTADQAKQEFENVKELAQATHRKEGFKAGKVIAVDYTIESQVVRVPMNKQKDDKRAEAYLTGMVNLLVAHSLGGRPCDYDPRNVPLVDHEGTLYAALSRRMDGSYPSTTNPKAMWEIKEYYYTTTFGSKISDAVYITSLDGFERLEVQRGTGMLIEHLVIVDAFDTWWGKGKSYLCRLVDVLNKGHVDEIIFGREVLDRIPHLVSTW